MAMSDARKRANKKYKEKMKGVIIQKKIELNRNTEGDLIEYIESLDNFSKTIKDFLRKEMEKK